MIKSISIASFLLVFSYFANAQTNFPQSKDEAKKYADGVLANLVDGNISRASSEIRKIMQLNSNDFDVFEAQIAKAMKAAPNALGASMSYEFVCERELGANLVQLQYFIHYEKMPINFSFVFFKAKNGWAMINFNFNDTVKTYFENNNCINVKK